MRVLPEMTLVLLYARHPVLFAQLTRLFGRQTAGRIVLEVHRQKEKR